jgi:hypothetical protein
MAETTEGDVLRGVESGTDRDALLFDFGIDSFKLGSEHEKYLRELIVFLEVPGTPPMTVSFDGFASRTKGTAEHNKKLSENRERAVEKFLREHSKVFGPGNLHTINPEFNGFSRSPPGENKFFRSVRIVVHRPDVKPDPKPPAAFSKRLVSKTTFEEKFNVRTPADLSPHSGGIGFAIGTAIKQGVEDVLRMQKNPIEGPDFDDGKVTSTQTLDIPLDQVMKTVTIEEEIRQLPTVVVIATSRRIILA